MNALHELVVENERLRRLVATLEEERQHQQERTRCVDEVLDELDGLRNYVALLERAQGGPPQYMSDALDQRDKAEEALRYLSHRLLVAQEEERRRVARELHDEIGQVFTATKICLHALLRSADDPARSRITACMAGVDQAIRGVRDLSLQLRPPFLDDLGLTAALRWHIDHLSRLDALVIHFTAPSSDSVLDPDVQVACFRVAQEALTNVLRHAETREAWVSLERTAEELRLIVRDEGVGFDREAARRRASQGTCLGLAGMQERATLANGTLEVASRPGGGTRVEARFPLVPMAAGPAARER